MAKNNIYLILRLKSPVFIKREYANYSRSSHDYYRQNIILSLLLRAARLPPIGASQGKYQFGIQKGYCTAAGRYEFYFRVV